MPKHESARLTPERPLTTGKVAELLQVTPTTVRGMCERGELVGAVRIGDWWRIPRGALAPYLHSEVSQ